MSSSLEQAAWTAIVISLVTSVAWIALLVRSLRSYAARDEKRPMWLAMPVVGLVAAIGTLASAIGFGAQVGLYHYPLDPAHLSLVASMGRGALLMGAVISLAYYHPPHGKE